MGLIKIYSKAGALMKAKEVFDDLSIRDMVTWTALISEYAQHGYGEEALQSLPGKAGQQVMFNFQ